MANCKGLAVNMRLAYAERFHGQEGLAQLVASLTPEHRATIEARVLPHAWVPMDLFIALNVNADRLFGKGDLALCQGMGAWAAEKSLPTLFRIFYRLGTPMFIFGKAAKLWSQHYDSGWLEPMSPGPNEVHLLLHELQQPHRAHCLSVLGWAARSIEMSGGTLAGAEELRCRTRGDDVCDLSLRWK
jgi:hypothetical protein